MLSMEVTFWMLFVSMKCTTRSQVMTSAARGQRSNKGKWCFVEILHCFPKWPLNPSEVYVIRWLISFRQICWEPKVLYGIIQGSSLWQLLAWISLTTYIHLGCVAFMYLVYKFACSWNILGKYSVALWWVICCFRFLYSVLHFKYCCYHVMQWHLWNVTTILRVLDLYAYWSVYKPYTKWVLGPWSPRCGTWFASEVQDLGTSKFHRKSVVVSLTHQIKKLRWIF